MVFFLPVAGLVTTFLNLFSMTVVILLLDAAYAKLYLAYRLPFFFTVSVMMFHPSCLSSRILAPSLMQPHLSRAWSGVMERPASRCFLSFCVAFIGFFFVFGLDINVIELKVFSDCNHYLFDD